MAGGVLCYSQRSLWKLLEGTLKSHCDTKNALANPLAPASSKGLTIQARLAPVFASSTVRLSGFDALSRLGENRIFWTAYLGRNYLTNIVSTTK